MKYLLVLVVVGLGLWLLVTRLRRGGGTGGEARRTDAQPPAGPVQMVEMVACAHCGLHLAHSDAVPEGARLYCSEAHRRLGPGPAP